MNTFVRHMTAIVLALFVSTSVSAQDFENELLLQDLDIELTPSDIIVADNSARPTYKATVPNIPDSAFREPIITENNIHEYLGLASMAMGAVAAMSVPESYDPDLLNSVHYKSAKLSWQLGAAAVASGLYSHWDDFHLSDGLMDRDNLHALLGLVGTLGYYLAVSSAVDEYNNQGYPSTKHASRGILGGTSMFIAIGLTW